MMSLNEISELKDVILKFKEPWTGTLFRFAVSYDGAEQIISKNYLFNYRIN